MWGSRVTGQGEKWGWSSELGLRTLGRAIPKRGEEADELEEENCPRGARGMCRFGWTGRPESEWFSPCAVYQPFTNPVSLRMYRSRRRTCMLEPW
ncbi:hypothetical protein chiPu_0031618 [Chiloscyllium punctatum]|uniref:Uncharacterized protein n=1 Tax=Chiloscyllium punctatum TaxID=137246 RepID=A0A401TY10_CHIPU|nr:hypothetical protein [Chiloscyllium punctatum]